MRNDTMDRKSGLHVIAASVLLALGASHAGAQEIGQPGADQAPLPTQQPERQDPLSDRGSQDSALQQESASQQDSAFDLEQDSGSLSADAAGGAGSLDELAQGNSDLSTFIEALRAVGMEQSLTDGTEYTVFAPTNDAFEQMTGRSVEELMDSANREELISLLRAHIVADDVDETMARSLPQAQTIDGGAVSLSAEGDEIRVGDARVVDAGSQLGSLRIYSIDQVLEPTVVARADIDSSSDTESGSLLDDAQSDFDTEQSDFGLDTERDSGLDLPERDDSFGSDRPGAGELDPASERSGAESLLDRLESQN